MFEHCSTIYQKMLRDSTPEVINVLGKDGSTSTEATGYAIYEGYLTSLFSEAGMAAPYYTTVTKMLRNMGCAEQVSRGGGAKKSKWRLITEPTEELYMKADAIGSGREPTSKTAMNTKQVNDLTKRVDLLEEQMTALLESLMAEEAK